MQDDEAKASELSKQAGLLWLQFYTAAVAAQRAAGSKHALLLPTVVRDLAPLSATAFAALDDIAVTCGLTVAEANAALGIAG